MIRAGFSCSTNTTFRRIYLTEFLSTRHSEFLHGILPTEGASHGAKTARADRLSAAISRAEPADYRPGLSLRFAVWPSLRLAVIVATLPAEPVVGG